MRYSIKKNYNTFELFEENKLDARAYFVPFDSFKACKSSIYYQERQDSKLVTMLNGKWDFLFFDRMRNFPDQIDTDQLKFDSIDVPSCWQYRGYEKPFYVNTRYMFDCFPPYVPEDEGTCGKTFKLDIDKKITKVYNTCGVYRKIFDYKPTSREIITFLGVSSCLELYINGQYVGYSEGSHNTAEFDVAQYLNNGSNEILAIVYKWCNGTYLECQDMFRSNGIFRDVYITAMGDNYIYDYDIRTSNDKNNWKIELEVLGARQEGVELECQLYYKDELLLQTVSDIDRIELLVADPKLWSAEKPDLYMLYINLVKNGKQILSVKQEVGFKRIKITKNVFYFNDKPIKIKGVNHHDTHPANGFTMTMEDLLKDVELMKELNVNAVRTSHYPPDPMFIKMANHYGLYIIDEADIETHGACVKKLQQPNLISNNKKWRNHFWDRVYRMYMRDRNNASIIMWSFGNESGGWKNQDYCYQQLKKLDSHIPLHYEAVCRTPRFAYDVISHMYTFTKFFEKYVNNKAPKKYYKKPFFLCEYAHAMGVGAGSLDIYWQLFNKSDGLMGGCIWEWADHAVIDKDGNYTYGGDHGEYVHDNNFCVDGVVYPDRTLSTTSYNVQNVYRPIDAHYVSNNKYKLFNRNYFVDSSCYDIKWEYLVEGQICAKGNVKGIIPANSSSVVEIKHPEVDPTKDCFVNFAYYRKSDGKFIAKEQIIISKNIKSNRIEGKGEAEVQQEGSIVSVLVDSGKISFDSATGKIISIEYKNLKLTQLSGLSVSVYRKPIDNFMYVKKKWHKQGLDNAQYELANFECKRKDACIDIEVGYNVLLMGKSRMRVAVEYKIFGNGIVDVQVELRSKKVYDLPAFGVQMQLPKQFDNVKYYGNGDKENYSDFKSHSHRGIYTAKTSQMFERYIRPQDSGNRTKVKWLEITDDQGQGLCFRSIDRSLDMSALPYSDEDLFKANHRQELETGKVNIVKVDGFVRGVGSNSCGEDARKEFRNHSGIIKYKFQISPLTK